MAGDFDFDTVSRIDIRPMSVKVYSVTSTTLPNKDVMYVYRTSDGTTARVVAREGNVPLEVKLPVDRFKEIILELEE
jgi:hypothetical protein